MSDWSEHYPLGLTIWLREAIRKKTLEIYFSGVNDEYIFFQFKNEHFYVMNNRLHTGVRIVQVLYPKATRRRTTVLVEWAKGRLLMFYKYYYRRNRVKRYFRDVHAELIPHAQARPGSILFYKAMNRFNLNKDKVSSS